MRTNEIKSNVAYRRPCSARHSFINERSGFLGVATSTAKSVGERLLLDIRKSGTVSEETKLSNHRGCWRTVDSSPSRRAAVDDNEEVKVSYHGEASSHTHPKIGGVGAFMAEVASGLRTYAFPKLEFQ